MTDPRVLVRLDVVVGLLGLVAVLLAVLIVVEAGQFGLAAVLLIGVAAAVAAREYRQLLDEAAAEA